MSRRVDIRYLTDSFISIFSSVPLVAIVLAEKIVSELLLIMSMTVTRLPKFILKAEQGGFHCPRYLVVKLQNSLDGDVSGPILALFAENSFHSYS